MWCKMPADHPLAHVRALVLRLHLTCSPLSFTIVRPAIEYNHNPVIFGACAGRDKGAVVPGGDELQVWCDLLAFVQPWNIVAGDLGEGGSKAQERWEQALYCPILQTGRRWWRNKAGLAPGKPVSPQLKLRHTWTTRGSFRTMRLRPPVSGRRVCISCYFTTMAFYRLTG
jgi:hypothetical protein